MFKFILKNHKQKRGQITAFIVIGLVILLTLVLYLYSQGVFSGLIGTLNVESVRGKVELCLAQNTEKALLELGRKNGYVYDVDFANSISTGNYTLNEKIIEQQINRYLQDTLPECINDFEDLKKYYNIDFGDEFVSEIIYKADFLVVKLYHPVKVADNLGKQIRQIDDFEIVIPARLKLILDLKENIEKDEHFISDYLIKNLELPVKQKQQSSKGYQKLLLDYIAVNSKKHLKKIKIANTDYKYSGEDVLWTATNDIYPRTSVEFSYKRLPLTFNNIDFSLKKGLNKKLLKYSDHLKRGAYDFDFFITMPVSVKIDDKLSFNKKGYEFNFVLPVELDFGQVSEQAETKAFDLEITSVSSDLENIGSSVKLENNEYVIVQVYNDDFYTVSFYPHDKKINLPKKIEEYKLEALLFRDYDMIGGYKSSLYITQDDLSKNKLKLDVLKFTGLTKSIILKTLEQEDYLDDAGFGLE